jgi:hypothetical protein
MEHEPPEPVDAMIDVVDDQHGLTCEAKPHESRTGWVLKVWPPDTSDPSIWHYDQEWHNIMLGERHPTSASTVKQSIQDMTPDPLDQMDRTPLESHADYRTCLQDICDQWERLTQEKEWDMKTQLRSVARAQELLDQWQAILRFTKRPQAGVKRDDVDPEAWAHTGRALAFAALLADFKVKYELIHAKRR